MAYNSFPSQEEMDERVRNARQEKMRRHLELLEKHGFCKKEPGSRDIFLRLTCVDLCKLEGILEGHTFNFNEDLDFHVKEHLL